MLNVYIFMVVCVCICVLLCVCKCMYVCFLGQGRTAMPTGLNLNYKSNQIFTVYVLCLLSTISTTVSHLIHQFYLDANTYIYDTRRPDSFVSVPLCHLSFTQCFSHYKSIQWWNSVSLEAREASYSDFVSYIRSYF